jgi:hypothetical protein
MSRCLLGTTCGRLCCGAPLSCFRQGRGSAQAGGSVSPESSEPVAAVAAGHDARCAGPVAKLLPDRVMDRLGGAPWAAARAERSSGARARDRPAALALRGRLEPGGNLVVSSMSSGSSARRSASVSRPSRCSEMTRGCSWSPGKRSGGPWSGSGGKTRPRTCSWMCAPAPSSGRPMEPMGSAGPTHRPSPSSAYKRTSKEAQPSSPGRQKEPSGRPRITPRPGVESDTRARTPITSVTWLR